MKSERKIATALFTDVIGSTERAAEMGDQAWRLIQARHHRIVREELRRWCGREITEAGDGFFALFDSPSRAIVCAFEIGNRVSALGLQIRAGLHMGQIERNEDGSAGGIAVHLGARVEAKAGPGEVLVTSAIHDAESGSGFEFDDLGRHRLKGIPREWRLFRVTGLPADTAALLPSPLHRLRERVGSRRLMLSAVSILLMLIIAVTAVRLLRPGPAVASGIRSIAVLPLENLTGDSTQEYFADGMTEAMIAELSKVGEIRVISRTSIMRFKGTRKPLSEIAAELQVDGVIEGSVARSGNQVRITAQLVHTDSDSNIWTDTYDGDMRDVLVLQSRVARDVAREIEIALSPAAEALLSSSQPVDPKTYDAYLRGMYHLHRAGSDDFQKGMGYLRESIETNPGSAMSHAGLSLGYATIGHGPASPPDAWRKAKAAAETALRLDPMLAAGHAALADVKTYYEWDWEGAEMEFRRANELNPNLSMNYIHYGFFLILMGRQEEAVAEYEIGVHLDPLSPLALANLAILYDWVGRREEALTAAAEALEANPDYGFGLWALGIVYGDLGMHEEAIGVSRKAVENDPAWRWGLARALAVAGQRAEALQIVKELEQEPMTPWNAFGLACAWATLGNQDQAFRWLAYTPNHAWLPWVRVWPDFSSLWNDPRFPALLARLKLPPVELKTAEK